MSPRAKSARRGKRDARDIAIPGDTVWSDIDRRALESMRASGWMVGQSSAIQRRLGSPGFWAQSNTCTVTAPAIHKLYEAVRSHPESYKYPGECTGLWPEAI